MGHVRPAPGKYKPGISVVNPDRTAKIIFETDKNFLAACEKLGAKPSVRQARDYRRKIGKFAKV